jgi:hypothetical protein
VQLKLETYDTSYQKYKHERLEKCYFACEKIKADYWARDHTLQEEEE